MKQIKIVIDASALLKAYFKDESGHSAAQELIRSYARGECNFIAPSLITYEIINACLVAHRKGRIALELAKEALEEMLLLEIRREGVEQLAPRIFDISCRYKRSAYDASYIALAEAHNCDLITGDERLYNAVSKHLKWVKLLGAG
ncbi:MAG: type II toxin-antitoxin system VapC family toxin [Thermodesulfobacteriota bacterium]